MRLLRKFAPLCFVLIFLLGMITPVLAQIPVIPLNLSDPSGRGLNFENYLTYTPLQHDVISHVLTLGYAAQLAGLVYFLATLTNIAPRYRLSSVLSAVVMSSAFLELWQLYQSWDNAFVFAEGAWRLSTTPFSNGYRYMNWSIDVPMLLLQLVVVLGLTRQRAFSYGTQFVIGGLLMIYTGYIGQFYEVTNLGWFFFWGAISTVFYIYVLFVIGRMINRSADNLPSQPDQLPQTMRKVFWYILCTWTLYPIAYLMPVIWPAAGGAVTRQILYTIADISSKVIYGAILSYIARKRSEAIEFEPAIASSRR